MAVDLVMADGRDIEDHLVFVGFIVIVRLGECVVVSGAFQVYEAHLFCDLRLLVLGKVERGNLPVELIERGNLLVELLERGNLPVELLERRQRHLRQVERGRSHLR